MRDNLNRRQRTLDIANPMNQRRYLRISLRSLVLLLVLLLTACAGGPQVSKKEAYRGQLAAGVVRPAGPEGVQVQQQLIEGLNASGGFAGVYPLWSANQSTEAQVIVEPLIAAAHRGRRGFERIELGISAHLKHERGRFRKAYAAKASGSGDALAEVSDQVSRDLNRRFGSRPVY